VRWEIDPDRQPLDAGHFICRATGRGHDTRQFRSQIADRFIEIQESVECIHNPACGFHIAEGMLLAADVPGDVIECGSYKGGMSCKMSIVAELLGKRLVIADSFAGLPHSERFDHADGSGWWSRGEFASEQSELEQNLTTFGAPQCCQIVAGWFAETLPRLQQRRWAFVFIDVDLVTSARTCILNLWPQLNGPRLYTHEACYQSYVDGILRPDWWRDRLGCSVPEIVGDGGFSDVPCLAYLINHDRL